MLADPATAILVQCYDGLDAEILSGYNKTSEHPVLAWCPLGDWSLQGTEICSISTFK